MRLLLFFGLIALTLVAGLDLSTAWAMQEPLPRGKRLAPPSSEQPAEKARYPALAYTVAILVALVVVTIVGFPSRKETWDQRIRRKRGAREIPWD